MREKRRERDGAEMNVERERESILLFSQMNFALFFFFIIIIVILLLQCPYCEFFSSFFFFPFFFSFFGRKGCGAGHVFFVVRERENGKGHKSSFLQILSGQVHAHPELRRVHFPKLRITYICYVTSVS